MRGSGTAGPLALHADCGRQRRMRGELQRPAGPNESAAHGWGKAAQGITVRAPSAEQRGSAGLRSAVELPATGLVHVVAADARERRIPRPGPRQGGHFQRRGFRPERARQPGRGEGQQAGVPGWRHFFNGATPPQPRRPSTATPPQGLSRPRPSCASACLFMVSCTWATPCAT